MTSSSTPAVRVLLVGGDPEDRALAISLLRSGVPGLDVIEAPDATAFAEALAREAFDAVVLEHPLRWSDGFALLELLRRLHAERPVVLWSAATDPLLLSRALALGIAGFVPKTSGGYLRLPEVVAELLERPARPAAEAGADLFAHAASHDLQEPVQHVVRYAQRISERLAARADEDERRDLEHLVTSAERVQSMLDGLLEWSRLAGRDRPFAPVELGVVVHQAVEALRDAIESAGGEVTHGSLPTVLADRSQMVQLFQNLIGNALKFHGDSPPRVHVSAREEDGSWVVSVQDQGIGIDPRDHERIFRMFQRLHPESRFPGRGIGLALCRRIAERHGGSLRVSSRAGDGATFSIVLPRRPADLEEAVRTTGAGAGE